MTYTPIARGTLNWDTPLNTALTQLDANTTSVLNSSLQAVNNLSDLTNVAQARSNLGLTALANITNNLTATTAPTASNDGTQGYTTGSLWLNTTTSIWYRNLSNATGAAVWTQMLDASSTQIISGSKTFQPTGSTNFTGSSTGQQLVVSNGFDVTSSGFRSQVLGDAFSRWVETVDGAMAWGGGTATRDVFLSRVAATILAIQPNLLVGSNTSLGDNGVGEIQLANATTPPTTNPTGGALMYSQGGNIKARNPQGLVVSDSGVINTIQATNTVTTTGVQSLAAFSIPANDPIAGATYEFVGYGVYTSNATATTAQLTLYWGTTAGTALCATPSFTLPASQSGSSFTIRAHLTFRSTTTVVGSIDVCMGNGTGTAIVELGASPSAVTVVTTSATPITIASNFNNAQSISITGGDFRRMS